MTIHVPEFGWQGDRKKVEFRDEKLIRATFEYAHLIGTDFTEAMRRALLIALPLIIENEKLAQARLAACFTQSNSTTLTSVTPLYGFQERQPAKVSPLPELPSEPSPRSKSTRSAADLI